MDQVNFSSSVGHLMRSSRYYSALVFLLDVLRLLGYLESLDERKAPVIRSPRSSNRLPFFLRGNCHVVIVRLDLLCNLRARAMFMVIFFERVAVVRRSNPSLQSTMIFIVSAICHESIGTCVGSVRMPELIPASKAQPTCSLRIE